MIKMWLDILKKARGRSTTITGSALREVLNDYIQSTGSLDLYFVEEVIENIYEDYKEKDNPTKKIGEKNFRIKANKFLSGYLPEEYEVLNYGKKILPDGRPNPKWIIGSLNRIRIIVKKNINEDLEKIRTRSGDRLKLRDWEGFKKTLRAGLNATVPRDIYNRKSNVRLTDGDFEDNKAVLNVSFRSLQGDRRYIHINFIEKDGDYYFTTIEGNIQLFDSEVIQTEAQLRERVIDLVEEIYIQEQEEYDLRDKNEEELTEEENIRQLEASNPDSYWDKERAMMVPKEKPPEEEETRNLNLEEAAKLGAKAKEKADKLKNLLAERKRKKGKGKDIKPLRGKRGRRDVS